MGSLLKEVGKITTLAKPAVAELPRGTDRAARLPPSGKFCINVGFALQSVENGRPEVQRAPKSHATRWYAPVGD